MSDLTPKAREIFLATQVDQQSMHKISKEILDIERHDIELCERLAKDGIEYSPKPITLYIDSYGGEVYSCFGLLSIMDMCTTPIRTVVTGCAMSCGFLIAIHGHERIAYPNATMMYHQVSSYAEGKISDMMQDAQEGTRLQERIERMTLSKTKITKARLRKVYETKTDWYIPVSMALRLGVVDRVAKSNVL